ncbi:uncharacterized protein LOC8268856 [Ricinus communis]|uniref:uncharacterized protein LOC8268856 n=1 Tax=Ricinus communis TaxID=3988 RepID=UPI00201AEA01|nr:uncharacterized protein LOC8268856 [Ricinus communis]
MDETETLQMYSEEEEIGDDFYEKIEAPKFVDLKAPDPYHHGDDRYWFCSRVGCDQKHEEDMDSETIYKNFVLRVMAARSPNIRLRKALYRKDACSSETKCPRTVPAKPSKPRVTRLALISSISKRIVDPKVKVKPISKQNAMLNAKAKQPSVIAKALTTPRTKKQLSNLDAFRSVRNPKTTATAMSKNRLVAKALVFHSPKKSVKTKSSIELKTPVKTLCDGMKKLEITGAKKQRLGPNKPLPSDTSRKQLRGREVKSRVFDGLLSQNHKVKGAKSSTHIKNNKEKNSQQNHDPAPPERDENDFIVMEIEGPLATIEASILSLDENKVEASSDATGSEGPLATIEASRSDSEKRSSGNDDDNVPKSQAPKEITERDDKMDTLTSDDKENDYVVLESDDKENASASNDNRELDSKTSYIDHKLLGKNETPMGNQKTAKAKIKQSKESSMTAATSGQLLQHKKPKPTNPKPFRLRTDERGILKEANGEKKHCPEPFSEMTSVSRIAGRNLQKRHQNALQKHDKFLEQDENHNAANENMETKDQPQKRTVSLKISKERVGRKTTSTPQRHTISSQQKLVTSQHECNQEKSALRLGNSSKRTKSPSTKQLARPQESASSRINSIMTTGQLGAIVENSSTILRAKGAAKPSEPGVSLATKASISPASKPSLQGKRLTTIPKEPTFHAMHTPKSCTKRVA